MPHCSTKWRRSSPTRTQTSSPYSAVYHHLFRPANTSTGAPSSPCVNRAEVSLTRGSGTVTAANFPRRNRNPHSPAGTSTQAAAAAQPIAAVQAGLRPAKNTRFEAENAVPVISQSSGKYTQPGARERKSACDHGTRSTTTWNTDKPYAARTNVAMIPRLPKTAPTKYRCRDPPTAKPSGWNSKSSAVASRSMSSTVQSSPATMRSREATGLTADEDTSTGPSTAFALG
ncbi:hypothetical protein DIPPA_02119 [Diplonema papillatum]|nr:hypothetical protein DIPPA_02119 [Diplonema papillatum]